MGDAHKFTPESAFLYLLGSLVALVLTCWQGSDANFVNTFRLIRQAQIANGMITATGNNSDCDDDGCYGGDYADYMFLHQSIVIGGRTYYSEVPKEMKEDDRVNIEYLVSNPQISRIQGTGTRTMRSWWWNNWLRVVMWFAVFGTCLFFTGKFALVLIQMPENPIPEIVIVIFLIVSFALSTYAFVLLWDKLIPSAPMVFNAIGVLVLFAAHSIGGSILLKRCKTRRLAKSAPEKIDS